MSRYPTPAPVDDFVLLLLPPCGPYLTPLATGSLEPRLLVSLLLGGPTRHRPFTPALHLHHRKSSHNLHLQYSAKSQSTPRCQSLIKPGSNHPPVLGRSGPQSFPSRTLHTLISPYYHSCLLALTLSASVALSSLPFRPHHHVCATQNLTVIVHSNCDVNLTIHVPPHAT
jgi:hypothetical protein